MATLPTAAWALCLGRRLRQRDLVFGEVASGRNLGMARSEAVVGPCWQYVPVRVRFEEGWTGHSLLAAVQQQHVASARHEGMALEEIAAACTDWVSTEPWWFDSVVHQDVAHVETLPFLDTACRTETVYPHEEPLREWKVQAYAAGDSLALEIVTIESWAGYATGLLDDLVAAMEELVQRPGQVLSL